MTIKMQAPVGSRGLSFDGQWHRTDPDGTILLPDEAAAVATSHGFKHLDDDKKVIVPLEHMTDDELRIMAYSVAKREIESLARADLIWRLRRAAGERHALPPEHLADGVYIDMTKPFTPERVAGMKKHEFFAYFRNKGIAMNGSTPLDAMRARVLKEEADQTWADAAGDRFEAELPLDRAPAPPEA